jgi:hypothetical protein
VGKIGLDLAAPVDIECVRFNLTLINFVLSLTSNFTFVHTAVPIFVATYKAVVIAMIYLQSVIPKNSLEHV